MYCFSSECFVMFSYTLLKFFFCNSYSENINTTSTLHWMCPTRFKAPSPVNSSHCFHIGRWNGFIVPNDTKRHLCCLHCWCTKSPSIPPMAACPLSTLCSNGTVTTKSTDAHNVLKLHWYVQKWKRSLVEGFTVGGESINQGRNMYKHCPLISWRQYRHTWMHFAQTTKLLNKMKCYHVTHCQIHLWDGNEGHGEGGTILAPVLPPGYAWWSQWRKQREREREGEREERRRERVLMLVIQDDDYFILGDFHWQDTRAQRAFLAKSGQGTPLCHTLYICMRSSVINWLRSYD